MHSTPTIGLLRCDDDMDQFGPVSTLIEAIVCDGSGGGSGGGGDGHIRTTAAGGTAAILIGGKVSGSSIWSGRRVCGSNIWRFCGIHDNRVA